MKTKSMTHPADGLPIQIETMYRDDLERDAKPDWASYAWRDGEIVGSGYGATRDIAEQRMWTSLSESRPGDVRL